MNENGVSRSEKLLTQLRILRKLVEKCVKENLWRLATLPVINLQTDELFVSVSTSPTLSPCSSRSTPYPSLTFFLSATPRSNVLACALHCAGSCTFDMWRASCEPPSVYSLHACKRDICQIERLHLISPDSSALRTDTRSPRSSGGTEDSDHTLSTCNSNSQRTASKESGVCRRST